MFKKLGKFVQVKNKGKTALKCKVGSSHLIIDIKIDYTLPTCFNFVMLYHM